MIVATSLCRASGLVGGYYATSLFIGAATGMAYGKFISFAISQTNTVIYISQSWRLHRHKHTAWLAWLQLLQGRATFPLHRIVVPIVGAVGLSLWITSRKMKERSPLDNKNIKTQNDYSAQKTELSFNSNRGLLDEVSYESELFELESSLCLGDSNLELREIEKILFQNP